MSQERKDQIMELLGENPCRSFDEINKILMENRKKFSQRKGNNSEQIVAFVIHYIPKVVNVRPYHEFIGDLDADLLCEFENAEPVYIQVKTSKSECEKYKNKIERRIRNKKSPRFAALCYEDSFEDTIIDFVAQVNKLEGRHYLHPVAF